MFKKIGSALIALLAALSLGAGVAQAVPPTPGDPHHSLPGAPKMVNGKLHALATSPPYFYAGYRQDLTTTQEASATGMQIRMQAWRNAVTLPAQHSIGEVALQKNGASKDVTIEAGYRSVDGASNLTVWAGVWVNGAFQGYNSAFTACTSSAVPGCSLPSWIPLGNNLSSGGQYTLKLWYTHVGTSSEGWWLYVQGSGACPAGKQCWLGYFSKNLWTSAVPAQNPLDANQYMQVFGEVYDPNGPGTAMGTGNCPNGSGGGALWDQYGLIGLTAADSDLDQFNVTSTPASYNVAEATDTSYRYGGTVDTGPPGC